MTEEHDLHRDPSGVARLCRCCRAGAARLLLTAPAARAELHIDITQRQGRADADRDPGLSGRAATAPRSARDIAGVVSADLERSGLFRPLDPRSFIQNVSTGGSPPRFGDWRQINAQALVTGSSRRRPTAGSRVEFRLWDVFAEQQLAGFAYTTTQQNWRRIAHIIADEIYKRITGEDGYFDTRIVYIAEIRAGAAARQAPGDHGPGRRQQSAT